jgi:opacity protein-like surface antigen
VVAPNYAFATPILGGQASVGMMAIVGNTGASLAGTLSGSLAMRGTKVQPRSIAGRVEMRGFVAAAFFGPFIFLPTAASADQGTFWGSGSFASWAATADQPGFSFTDDYTHSKTTGSGDVARQLALRIGVLPNVSLQFSGTSSSLGDTSSATLGYVFATPVLGGQAAVSMSTPYGPKSGTLDATLTAGAGSLSTTRSVSVSSDVTTFGDLFPLASLKWNQGVHNFMTYVTGDIPVGPYNSRSLTNPGNGFAAIDSGGGYTYFNDQTGLEFSAVAGFTYNFINPFTHYQNGVDFHADLAAAKMLSDQVFVGPVGYIYDQVTGDSGSGALLGAFESQIFGVGPQIGFLFPIGKMAGFLNLRAYYEFGAVNRAAGWNGWLTFSIAPPDPDTTAATAPRRGSITYSKARVPPPIPLYNWTGFYIGANLGGAWASGTLSDIFTAGSVSASKSGFVGGGQLGYNYQIGSFVFGAEWVFDGTALNVSGPLGGFSAVANTNGISTLAARFGWADNNWLWYGKAGGGWAGNQETLTNGLLGIQETAFRLSTGWMMGAGIEYAFVPNWTAKLEYDYLGLNTATFNSTVVGLNADQLRLARQINMLTIGMNYKFSP